MTERIEVVKRWIDPATIIILRSRRGVQIATYHMIFPFLIGRRKIFAEIMKRLKDQNDGLHMELMWRIDMDQIKRDAIIKSIDIQVMVNGTIRGFFQDK